MVSRNYGPIAAESPASERWKGTLRRRHGRVCARALEAGMVSSAAWVDYDGDSRARSDRRRRMDAGAALRRRRTDASSTGRSSRSREQRRWWNSVTVADVNDDGRQDLVLGNLGLNSYIRASREEPARLYVHDFFQNGRAGADPHVLQARRELSARGARRLRPADAAAAEQVPVVRRFGASRVEDILPADELKQGQRPGGAHLRQLDRAQPGRRHLRPPTAAAGGAIRSRLRRARDGLQRRR